MDENQVGGIAIAQAVEPCLALAQNVEALLLGGVRLDHMGLGAHTAAH